ANVEETSVGRVKVGQPVRVTVDEGGRLTGRVEEITAAAESQFSIIPMENPSGNFIKLVQRIPIRVALDDPSRLPLKAGESVEVRIRVR
ncbi:MAG TPA: HlyD family secretion protein, partial [bacterium]|nr:HlyD family secretion protein [bacterium]